jgi:hypothetical protein
VAARQYGQTSQPFDATVDEYRGFARPGTYRRFEVMQRQEPRNAGTHFDKPLNAKQSSDIQGEVSFGLQNKTKPINVNVATPARRRGPCLSRRTGQSGTVVQHSKTWDPNAPCYGKYWADVSECNERKRRTVSLGACTTKSVAYQRLREFLEREGINSVRSFRQNTAPGVTFRQQAKLWLGFLPARKRRPVKPATISGWRDALNAWLLPCLGDMMLAEISNKTLRELVEKMSMAGLSAKTIVNYVQVVKLVIASAVNEEGEQIYPRMWNHDFIQLPVVHKDKQHRPTVTDAELTQILSNTKKQNYVVLFALLAGTGLRIGEAIALRPTDFGPDCRVLWVRRSIWRGEEQEPKTSNANPSRGYLHRFWQSDLDHTWPAPTAISSQPSTVAR